MRFWLDILGFASRHDWGMAGYAFGEMWEWGAMNAMRSHDERPWSRLAFSQMLASLYPDEFPF